LREFLMRLDSSDCNESRLEDETLAAQAAIPPDTRLQRRGNSRFEAVKLVLAFVAIYFIWGSTYLAIRYAVETFPPFVAACLRQAVAGTILLAWALGRGFRPTMGNWLAGLIIGALFFLIGHGSLHWAQQYVSSGLAALLIATEPLFILVLAWLAGRQRINRLSVLGLTVGLFGVALLAGGELTATTMSFVGVMAILLSSLSWSVGVVVAPALKLPSDPLGRAAIPLLCGAGELFVAAWITGELRALDWSHISLRSTLGLAYLIVFGSIIAFTSYTWLLQRCPATLVATHTYVNPLVAVFLGWLAAAEPVSLWVILATVAIPGAILLVRAGERRAADPALPAGSDLGECDNLATQKT
jgi:drug/metabolite transporter (DMT)-like permease